MNNLGQVVSYVSGTAEKYGDVSTYMATKLGLYRGVIEISRAPLIKGYARLWGLAGALFIAEESCVHTVCFVADKIFKNGETINNYFRGEVQTTDALKAAVSLGGWTIGATFLPFVCNRL